MVVKPTKPLVPRFEQKLRNVELKYSQGLRESIALSRKVDRSRVLSTTQAKTKEPKAF